MWIVCLIIIGIMLMYLFIKRFQIQLALLEFSIIPYAMWIYVALKKDKYVSIFAIQEVLFEKIFGTNMNVWLVGSEEIPESFEFAVCYFAFMYLFIVCLTKMTKWSMAAIYGSVASIAISCLIQFVNILLLNNKIPGFVVFAVTLIGTVLFMRKGFHSIVYWVPFDKKVLSLVVGAIPTLFFVINTFCNIFTISFGTTVVGKLGYAIATVILSVVFCGVGVFLYFCFEDKYIEIMKEKIEQIKVKYQEYL